MLAIEVVGCARHPHREHALIGHVQLTREARGAGDVRGEIEQIVFFLACWRQKREIVAGDDHMAGRTGHRPFAAALQRLAIGLSEIEQICSRSGFDVPIKLSVGLEEADSSHPTIACASAAALSISHAATISSVVV